MTHASVLLRIDGVLDGNLVLRAIGRAEATEARIPVKTLSEALLPALEKIADAHDLCSIRVATDRLGSFTASRTILTVVNTYAWLKDIRVEAIRSDDRGDREARERCAGDHGFKEQLSPRYLSGPDVSEPKRTPKFTFQD